MSLSFFHSELAMIAIIPVFIIGVCTKSLAGTVAGGVAVMAFT